MELAPKVMADFSAHRTDPSADFAVMAPVALTIAMLAPSLAATVMVDPSVMVGVTPWKVSLPTTMLAVRSGSPEAVLAGSVNSPRVASMRKVPPSRKVMRTLPRSAVSVTVLPSAVEAVMAPSVTPAPSTATSGVTALGVMAVVPCRLSPMSTAWAGSVVMQVATSAGMARLAVRSFQGVRRRMGGGLSPLKVALMVSAAAPHRQRDPDFPPLLIALTARFSAVGSQGHRPGART